MLTVLRPDDEHALGMVASHHRHVQARRKPPRLRHLTLLSGEANGTDVWDEDGDARLQRAPHVRVIRQRGPAERGRELIGERGHRGSEHELILLQYVDRPGVQPKHLDGPVHGCLQNGVKVERLREFHAHREQHSDVVACNVDVGNLVPPSDPPSMPVTGASYIQGTCVLSRSSHGATYVNPARRETPRHARAHEGPGAAVGRYPGPHELHPTRATCTRSRRARSWGTRTSR